MAVLIEVKVIGIGKLLDRRHMVVRRHIRDGAAAYDPDHVMRFVPLEPHHDIRGQAVLHVDVFYAGFIDDINTAAVMRLVLCELTRRKVNKPHSVFIGKIIVSAVFYD